MYVLLSSSLSRSKNTARERSQDQISILVLCFVREEQYRQVWAELETFLEAASNTSKMHEKVMHLYILLSGCQTFLL